VQYSVRSQETPGIAALASALEPRQIIPLEELERRAITECMEYTRGDRGTAAVLLGIGRTTLYRKLKAYNLEVGEPGARCNL
jgi:DNA-binding NtrC family response regulator